MITRVSVFLFAGLFLAGSLLSQDDSSTNMAKVPESEKAIRAKLAQAILDGSIPLHRLPTASTSADNRIFSTLEKKMSVKIESERLDKLLRRIATEHGIRVWLNTAELDFLGISAQTPISLELSSKRLRSVLSLLLEPLQLTFMVRNNVLEITSKGSAESAPLNRVYKIPMPISKDMDSLLNVVQQNVSPDTWLAAGGTSRVLPLGDLLIVSAPLTTHYDVQDLLARIVEKQKSR